MKSKKELLEKLLEDNYLTMYAKKLDLRYHKDILLPRYAKETDKKIREQKISNAKREMQLLEILVKDLEGIIEISKEMIEKAK